MIASGPLPPEDTSSLLNQQILSIKETKTYILFVLAAVFISYCVTATEEKRLICAVEKKDCSCLPDTCPMRVTSSVMIFWALIYFYLSSLETAVTPASDPLAQCLACLNFDAALLSLIAGGLRLYTTFKACCPKLCP